MKNRQSGFSAVEILLIVVIIGLLGFIGWSAYQALNNKGAIDSSKDTVGLATLSGTVTEGPTSPMSQGGEPTETPVADHTIQAVDAKGKIVDSTKTDATGKYQLHLPPGQYSLELVPSIGPGDSKVASVQVKSGTNTYNVSVDTGIR